MKVQQQGSVLSVSEIVELAAANSGLLKSSLESVLTPAVKEVEIDLAGAEFIDCAGAGALVSFRRQALEQNPDLRFSVRPPRPPLRRVFALTGLSTLFPAEQRTCAGACQVSHAAPLAADTDVLPSAPAIPLIASAEDAIGTPP